MGKKKTSKQEDKLLCTGLLVRNLWYYFGGDQDTAGLVCQQTMTNIYCYETQELMTHSVLTLMTKLMCHTRSEHSCHETPFQLLTPTYQDHMQVNLKTIMVLTVMFLLSFFLSLLAIMNFTSTPCLEQNFDFH